MACKDAICVNIQLLQLVTKLERKYTDINTRETHINDNPSEYTSEN